ncbi:hypothetical protein HJA90_10955 [Rhizobium bangladeshense]|uniref:hypothetical protein n=1 Tax=Rhizobium bangladeshense TaxID=1138189 RepID=UPI001C82A599|nr:hypothetical protein [Rhizobium bangladeshense]MBX4884099.1 hypothetical protein [Rhizobium bangladeshense]
MEGKLLLLIEKLQAAKDIAEQSGQMRMAAYFLDMAIVEAEEELDLLVSDRRDEPKLRSDY